MRPLKLRAYVKDSLPFGESGMCDVKSIHWKDNQIWCIHVIIPKESSPNRDQDYWQIMAGNFELMQFTGLTDKNGVEIYEGDIFQYANHKGYLLPDISAEIIYMKDYACFGYLSVNNEYGIANAFHEHDCLEEDFLHHCTVIGNIYDNPELLKGEK